MIFGAILVFFTSSFVYQLVKHNYVPTLDKLFTTLDDVYYSSFARALPYFIGGAMGFLHATEKFDGVSKVSNFKKFLQLLNNFVN